MLIKIYRLCVAILLAVGITSCQSLFPESHITPAPSPQCVEPFLTVGNLVFKVDSVTREGNNFPEIPKRKKDIAYWVEGTTVNFVFGLSPTDENLNLKDVLKAGDPIVINWADCTNEQYVLKSVETVQAGDASIFDQSAGGVTIFVGVDASSPGLVIRGERPIVQSNETPVPTDENAIHIDLEILGFTQPDDQTVQFQISITNRGGKAITLTGDDISLNAEGQSEAPPEKVEPALPQELQPGQALPLTLTFLKPQGNSAVLRIFDVTFEYYF